MTFYHLTRKEADKQHLFISRSIGATVWGIEVATPADTLNVDSSAEVTVTRSWIMNGDDCVAMTTNNSAESAVTVSHLLAVAFLAPGTPRC